MADTNPDLLFQDPVDGALDLVFGGGSFTPPLRRVSVLVTVGGVTAHAMASQPVRAYAGLLVGGVSVNAGVYYDNRVTPWLDARYLSGQQAAISKTGENGEEWGVSKWSELKTGPSWQPAKFGSLEQTDKTKASLPMLPEVDIKHTLGDGRTVAFNTRSEIAKFVDTGRSTAYSKANPQRALTSSGMQSGIFKVQARAQNWQDGAPRQIVRSGSIGKGITNQGHNGLASAWVVAGLGKAGMGSPPAPKPKSTVPVAEVVNTQIFFQCPSIARITSLIFGGKSPCDAYLTGTKIIPIRRVYIVINNASLRRVDGNIQLPVMSMSLSLDADSWTWGLNAVLSGESLPALLPAQDSLPMELEAEVNGQLWRFLLERMTRS